MCRMLYIGSDRALSPVLRCASDPVFNLGREPVHANALREVLGRKFIHGAGANGCGCGFNYEVWGPEHGRDDPDMRLKERSIEALVNYLRTHLAAGESVELLYCWIGEEKDPASPRREITTAELLAMREREGIPERGRFRVVRE